MPEVLLLSKDVILLLEVWATANPCLPYQRVAVLELSEPTPSNLCTLVFGQALSVPGKFEVWSSAILCLACHLVAELDARPCETACWMMAFPHRINVFAPSLSTYPSVGYKANPAGDSPEPDPTNTTTTLAQSATLMRQTPWSCQLWKEVT